jgi:putative ABC transport system permease protein
VVVDQAFARAAWSAGDGLGRTIRVGAGGGAAMTVVGVTGRLHTRGLDRETPTLFLPLGSTDFDAGLTIVARTTAPPADLTRPVIAAAEALAPDVPLAEVKTMDDRMAVPLWPFRTVSWMFSICAALALLLAAVGLAGLVIHAVTRRVREFGVRMSLGATPGDIVRGVLAGSLTLGVPGLAAGLLLAGGAARLTRAVFVGVDVLAPWTYVAVAIAQCAIIVLASLVPALRAGRVDPIDALRAD